MRRRILPWAEELAVLTACMVGALVAQVPTPRDMRGPFPILSVPYHADGAVDYEVLAKEAQWVDDSGCPGVIWAQSNDAIDLLTRDEKAKSFEAVAAALEGRPITLALGANGTNATEMLEIAAEIEQVAARHPRTKIAMISRPPDDVRSEAAIEAAWEALAAVAKRPVIFQTHGTKKTPTPSVELIVRLAKRHPLQFGYVKEEAAGNEANERMVAENAAKPDVKTVFAGWGGWQWLLQLRHCGCEGLVTERCAYAPVLGEIWRRYERGERGLALTEAFAMYRLLVDQRNFPGGLRGYSLYLLMKEGVFKNMVSRQYEKAKVTEGGSFGDGRKWKLETVKLSDRQKAELDLLYADMLAFCASTAAAPAQMPQAVIHSEVRDGVTLRWFEEMVPMKDGVRLYTYGVLPPAGEKCAIVFQRSPYVKEEPVNMPAFARNQQKALARGYAYVFQHVRGTGMSEGDWVPYVAERADGLSTLEWIRHLPHYNGEIFIAGGSYCASVHWSYLGTNPPDVKGAVLTVQDVVRYNIHYRNGHYKSALHGNWVVKGYKKKNRNLKRDPSVKFTDLPLKGFSERRLGERVADLEDTWQHPRPEDAWWRTEGTAGNEFRRALLDSTMPVLMVSGFYDIYTEGLFDMWRELPPARRANCALVVDAFDHGGRRRKGLEADSPVFFPNGSRHDEATRDSDLDWFDWCRGKGTLKHVRPGETRWYSLWGNEWRAAPEMTDAPGTLSVSFTPDRRLSFAPVSPGGETVRFSYDPSSPPSFPGAGCLGFGGMREQPAPGFREDVVSFVSGPSPKRYDVCGRMKLTLSVSTDCDDTAFFVRVSIRKRDGKWYTLRDDIKSISWDHPDYVPGAVASLAYTLSDHAFVIEEGDCLRVDVAGANAEAFIPHTNFKGPFAEQTKSRVAHDTLFPAGCSLVLPVAE